MKSGAVHSEAAFPAPYALDRLRLTFKDRDIERAYQRDSLKLALPVIRLFLFVGTILYILFGLLDAMLCSGTLLHQMWGIRFGIVAPINLAVLALTYQPKFADYAQPVLLAAMGASGLGVIAMTAIMPAPYNGLYYAGLISVTSYCGTMIRLRFTHSAMMAIGLLVMYQVVALSLNPVPLAVYASNNFFLVMSVGVGICASYLHEIYMRRAYVSEIVIRAQNDRTEHLLLEATVASKAKSEFLATMSHELRTPLNAICGFSEILKKEMFGPIGKSQYAEYAEDIHQSGSHLLSIINDILDLAKAEAGKLALSEGNIDLSDTLSTAIRMCHASANDKGIDIAFVNEGSAIGVRADERLIRQAVLNLLSNAIKFTKSGGSVRVEARLNASGALEIDVVDTGVGIDEDDLARVLRPFEQVESAMSRQNGGTGLGLPYCVKIAEIHGGSLALESTLGVGTRCRLVIPAERLLPVAEDAPRLAVAS